MSYRINGYLINGSAVVWGGRRLSDQGAGALAERLGDLHHERYDTSDGQLVKGILGTTGLFIPDAARHEPIIVQAKEDDDHVLEPTIQCICGWAAYQESFFDHLGRPPKHLVDGQLG